MITSPGERRAISTLGWIDHGAVWVFDAGSSEPSTIRLSDAKYLTLHGGRLNHFAAVHHWDGERVSVTVQTYEEPGHDVCRMDVTGWTGTISGDDAAWATLPNCYLSYLNHDATGAGGYYLIRRFGPDVEVSRLDWFDQGNWDHAYQGVVSVFEVPETGETLFGIQRSSAMMLCSPDGSSVLREVHLPGHVGNPVPRFSALSSSVWVTDYDTVARLDRRTWSVEASADLSPERMFVGSPWLTSDERYLTIPRPGSGDVVILDAQDLQTSESIYLGRQPLTAAILEGGQVVGRDWKTGDALLGQVAKLLG